ncbi:unnamed protein product [Penicillium glandicola]
MSQAISRTSWFSVLLALLAISTVNAHPIREEMEQGQAGQLESRSPRLIPDTQKYVHSLLQGLGLEEPTSTPTPTATPTAVVKTEQESENTKPTQTMHIVYSSTTSYTPTDSSNAAGYTHTVEHVHSNIKPVGNVQFGHGWNVDEKFDSKDLPVVFDAVYKQLAHEFKNAIDSSDEIGLDSLL